MAEIICCCAEYLSLKWSTTSHLSFINFEQFEWRASSKRREEKIKNTHFFYFVSPEKQSH